MNAKNIVGFAVAFVLGACGGYFAGRSAAAPAAVPPVPETTKAKPSAAIAEVRPAPAAERTETVVAASAEADAGADEDVPTGAAKPAVARPKDVVTHAEALDFVATELAGMWGDDRKKTAEGLRRLGTLGRATLLACLRERQRLGSAQERESAILSIGALFGDEAGKMKKMVDDGKGSFAPAADEDEGTVVSDKDTSDGLSDAERAARQTKEIVKAISDGLSDADGNVRSAAYDAMNALGSEEAGILKGQIFSGDDQGLKLALLQDAAGSSDEAAVMTSISGLENADRAVAAKAAENLKAATGQDFTSEQQALDWWEAHGNADETQATAE